MLGVVEFFGEWGDFELGSVVRGYVCWACKYGCGRIGGWGEVKKLVGWGICEVRDAWRWKGSTARGRKNCPSLRCGTKRAGDVSDGSIWGWRPLG
jgi:hypothetical protein